MDKWRRNCILLFISEQQHSYRASTLHFIYLYGAIACLSSLSRNNNKKTYFLQGYTLHASSLIGDGGADSVPRAWRKVGLIPLSPHSALYSQSKFNFQLVYFYPPVCTLLPLPVSIALILGAHA